MADDLDILQEFAHGGILGSILAAAGQLRDRGQQRGRHLSSNSPPHLLLAACLRGDLVRVHRLASHPSISIKASPAFLHAAIKGGHLEVVDFLLKKGADSNTPINDKCPLHYALIFDQFEIFKTLLNSGADLSRLYKELPHVLQVASSKHHINLIQLLVRKGADVNFFGPNGTALHNGNLEIAEFLVQNGADVNAQSELARISPLHVAAGQKDGAALVDFLIRSGAVVDSKDRHGATPFHVAVDEGNLCTMKILLAAGADINALDNQKMSPLQHAIFINPSIEAIKFLVESGANVWAENDDGSTVFEFAEFQRVDENVMKILVSSPPPAKNWVVSGFTICRVMENYSEEILEGLVAAGVNVTGPFNSVRSTPLHYAAATGSIKVVEILVAAGSNVDALDANNKSPVDFALQQNHMEVAEFLLARSSVKGQSSELLDSRLTMAFLKGRYSLGRLLIQRGANINATETAHGMSLLRTCVIAEGEDQMEQLKFLLEEGADPDAACEAFPTPPLALAVSKADLQKVKMLVTAGANVNWKGQQGTTPFLMACQMGELPIISFLVEAGANLFDTFENKTTALHIASMFGRLEAMKFLVSKGADVNAANDVPRRHTPLHLAAGAIGKEALKMVEVSAGKRIRVNTFRLTNKAQSYGCLSAARLLVEEGADMNAVDGKRRSALHYFCAQGELPAVAFLIENGAKVDDVSFTRGSPLHSACEAGHYSIVDFLLTQGADVAVKNDRGDPAASTAALGGHWKLLPLLGVNDPETLPLQMAASRGELPKEISPALINSLGVLGYSALHFGALNGHLSVVRRLLSLGAHVTLKGNNEHVVHSAIRGKNVDVVSQVLDAIEASCKNNGSEFEDEVNQREDSAQETPLMTAVRTGRLELVKLLAEEDAVDLDLQNADGLTALHIALDGNHIDISKFLVAMQVDRTLRDNFGRTADDIAKQNAFLEIFRVLPNVPQAGDPPLTSEADPVPPENEVKSSTGKQLEEKDGNYSSEEEEETQGLLATQSPITQQPFTSTVVGAQGKILSVTSEEERRGASGVKEEQRPSSISAICCCSSSD